MRKTNFVLMTAIVMLTASSVSAEVLYDLTDLGSGLAYSINNSGQVVGTAGYPSWELPGGSFALVPNATIFDPTGEGNNIYLGEGTAYSINNYGQIVGRSGIFTNHMHAALFDPTDDGSNYDLTILSDSGSNGAYSINDSGEIVGYAGGAVLFDPSGVGNNINLGNGNAYSINNDGQIVGQSKESIPFPGSTIIPSLTSYNATLFDPTGNGNNLDLDPDNSSFMDDSKATSINNYGQIVGYMGGNISGPIIFITNPPGIPMGSPQDTWQVNIVVGPGPPIIIDPNSSIIDWDNFDIPTSLKHAALFDPTGDGDNIDLGTLPDGGDSIANSINDNGQVVGYAYTSSEEKHAVMFDPTGGGDNVDLNDLIDPALGWTLMEAQCINDNGWIVGQMTNAEGDVHAFLLRPPIETRAYVFPRVLNSTSRGGYVIARMELPAGITKDDVADDSLRLIIGDTVIGTIRQRGISSGGLDYVFGFFNRGRVIAQADGKDKLDIVIAGELTTGQYIYGEDSIRIVKPRKQKRETSRRRSVRSSRRR